VSGSNEAVFRSITNRAAAFSESIGRMELLSSTKQEDEQRQRRIMELYETHSAGLYKYLRGLGLVREEAEDMVQEAFLRLANHLIAGGENINLRSWLYQVGHNLSMDIHREHSWSITSSDITNEILGKLVDPKSDPEGTVLHEERIKHVKQAMTRLTPKQRSGVLLRSQGLRYTEIASVLNVSESRAIYLVKRGLILLAGGQ